MTTRERDPRLGDEVVPIPDAEETAAVDLPTVIDHGDARAVHGTPGPVLGTSVLRRYRLIGWLLVLLDVLCLTTALLVAHALRFGFIPDWMYLAQLGLGALLWPGVFHALRLYSPQHMSALEEFRRTTAAVGIGIVVLILLTFWTDVYLSRSWMAITLAIALILELSVRMLVRHYVARLRSRNGLMLRTLIIGNLGQVNEPMELLGRQGSGFLPLGWVDASSPLIASEGLTPTERVSRLRLVYRHFRADCVVIASTTLGAKQLFAVMQAARQEGVVVRIYTHLSGIWASRLTAQPMGNEGIALTVRPAGLSTTQRVVKRAMDIVLATIGLMLVAPVLAVSAIAIRITSGAPTLFRQERVTEGARTFLMYKFRTMTNGAEHEARERGLDTAAPFFKLREDSRLTRVGALLRRWSLDELPQLFNVLIGDMSLVGPRPLPAEQVSANIELLGPRHEVRSGITGWWQIQGRSNVTPEDAVRMDHFYIENWSPALDVYILLRTVGVLFSRRGAY